MDGLSIQYAKLPETKRNSTLLTRKPKSSQHLKTPSDRILFLQRTIGNQAVQRLIKSGTLRAKLKIGQPGDKYEQEADRVAEQVMRMPEPGVQRHPEENEDEELQAKEQPGHTAQVPPQVAANIQSLKGGGQPLSHLTRSFFEARFDQDFSQVRIHRDAKASRTAKAVNARAFTLGQNVVFGAGEYSSGTSSGRKLLAHELVHVVQQDGGGNAGLKRALTPFSANPTRNAAAMSTRAFTIGNQAGAERIILRSPPEKKAVTKWEDDYYYNTKKEAQQRVKKLKKTWTDARYHEVKVKGVTKWQVQKLGPEKAPSKTEPKTETKKGKSWTADANNFKKREDAEKRKKDLVAEDEWEKYRVTDIKKGENTFYRVEMQGKLKPGTTEFALTFDDGPHTASLGKGVNLTEKVLDSLAVEGIQGKGAFFVQTHAPYRGSTTIGTKLIKRMFTENYTVGIHTGGKKDHESHTSAQKAGRLEGELEQAKKHLKGISRSDPSLVRAPYGKTNAEVRKVYAKLSLTHLHWDIDGDPGGSHPLEKLKGFFDSGLSALKRGSKGTFHPKTGASSRIIVLFHDIRKGTANNIRDMIKHIKKRVPKAKFEKP